MNVDQCTLNNLSLCSGGGGLDLGLELALGSLRTVCWVEWEAFAINYLVEAMEAKCLAQAPVWTDLRTFDGRPWRGVVDCLTAGYPCFAGGTLVLTEQGYRPIESLAVGDRVLTHLGRWRSVTAVMRREDANLREIHAQGCPGIVTTDEHPFYCRHRQMQWDNTARHYQRRFTESQWRPSRELTKDSFLAQVLPDEQPDAHSIEFWWLVGRYLACGWLVDRKSRGNGKRAVRKPSGRVVICANARKAKHLEEGIRDAGFRAYREETRTAIKYHITKTDLYRFLLSFGRLAHGKRLPGWVFSLPKEKAAALVEGYLEGDGYDEGCYWRASSTSKPLALSIALLAQRAYGVVAGVRFVFRPSKYVIEGRVVRQRPYWTILISKRNRVAFVDGKYGWKQVRANESYGVGTVYNIAVDEDESYIADGAVVHNCQPFSVAGKRRGEGDPRHLWPHVRRVVSEVEPAIVFLENVPGHLSLGFETVAADLQAMGYGVAVGLFTASEVGASHRRERLFIVAQSDLLSAGGGCQQADDEERRSSNHCESTPLSGRSPSDRGPASTGGPLGDTAGIRCGRREDARASNGHAQANGRGCQQSERASPALADAKRPRQSRTRTITQSISTVKQPCDDRCKGSRESLADTANDYGRCGVGGEKEGIRPEKLGRRRLAGGGEDMANSPDLGLQVGASDGKDVQQELASAERGRLPLFPPGPGEIKEWQRVLETDPTLEPAICNLADELEPLNDNQERALQACKTANFHVWREVCQMRLAHIVGKASSRSLSRVPSNDSLQAMSRAIECCEEVGWSEQAATLRNLRNPISLQEAATNGVLPIVRLPQSVEVSAMQSMMSDCSHRLRLLGNGVAPLQAAYAFVSLWSALNY